MLTFNLAVTKHNLTFGNSNLVLGEMLVSLARWPIEVISGVMGKSSETEECVDFRGLFSFLLPWEQDDSEDSETDGDEEDGSQSSTNLQPQSRFHR